jgi:hypothetical protein
MKKFHRRHSAMLGDFTTGETVPQEEFNQRDYFKEEDGPHCIRILIIFLVTSIVTFTFLSIYYRPSPRPPSLSLDVVSRMSSGIFTHRQLTFDANDTLFYVDAWRSHWCS